MCQLTLLPSSSSNGAQQRHKIRIDEPYEGGDTLRRLVLLKAATKVIREPLVIQEPLVAPVFPGWHSGLPRRTVVADLDLLCCSLGVCSAGGHVTHQIWLRPYVRTFLTTLRPLFRLAVWSKNGGAWVDAALKVLDPEHQLLPRRPKPVLEAASSLPEPPQHTAAPPVAPSGAPPPEVECAPVIVDDGQPVHPADVVIVAPDRTAFGTMSHNVIEVERFTAAAAAAATRGDELGGDDDDDVLMQLAGVLVRHLACPPPPEGPWEAAAAAVASWGAGAGVGVGVGGYGCDGPPMSPMPPVASELRRLGLLRLRICRTARAETTTGVAAAAAAAADDDENGSCGLAAGHRQVAAAAAPPPPAQDAPTSPFSPAPMPMPMPVPGRDAEFSAYGPSTGGRALQLQRRSRPPVQAIAAVDVLSLVRRSRGPPAAAAAAAAPAKGLPSPSAQQRREGRRRAAGGPSRDAAALGRMPAWEIASAAAHLAEETDARLRQHRRRQRHRPHSGAREGAVELRGRSRSDSGPAGCPGRPEPEAAPPPKAAAAAPITPLEDAHARRGEVHVACGSSPVAATAAAEAEADDEGVAGPVHHRADALPFAVAAGAAAAGSTGNASCTIVRSATGPDAAAAAAASAVGASAAAADCPLRRSISAVGDATAAAAAPRRQSSKGRPGLASCFAFSFGSFGSFSSYRPRCSEDGSDEQPERGGPGADSCIPAQAAETREHAPALTRLADAVRRSLRRRLRSFAPAPAPASVPASASAGREDPPGTPASPPLGARASAEPSDGPVGAPGDAVERRATSSAVAAPTAAAPAAAQAVASSGPAMELLVLGGALRPPRWPASAGGRIALLCDPAASGAGGGPVLPGFRTSNSVAGSVGVATNAGWQGWCGGRAAPAAAAAGGEMDYGFDLCMDWAEMDLDPEPAPPAAAAAAVICSASPAALPPRQQCQLGAASLSEPGCAVRVTAAAAVATGADYVR